jgi:hypothetical protein
LCDRAHVTNVADAYASTRRRTSSTTSSRGAVVRIS